ncbi:putative transcriptional regulator [Klebsiella pneumoniae]|uniref:Putative transcriptional regulator n=1 Tax=Klebsiella pneumoniae TaxID=573 RepID=A0A377W092_KLEPN|nr:putative transcriptional regulator [Klebsiella pneumoniae]
MAKQESLRTSECPVARTLESIGERWCLMIIREAFGRCEEIQRVSKKIWGWPKISLLAAEASG